MIKVGDKVRIKEGLEISGSVSSGTRYGGCYFTSSMDIYSGKKATVTKISAEPIFSFVIFKLTIDKGKWNWTEEMLELVEEKERTYNYYISIDPSKQKKKRKV